MFISLPYGNWSNSILKLNSRHIFIKTDNLHNKTRECTVTIVSIRQYFSNFLLRDKQDKQQNNILYIIQEREREKVDNSSNPLWHSIIKVFQKLPCVSFNKLFVHYHYMSKYAVLT